MATVAEKPRERLQRTRFVEESTGRLLFTYKDLIAMEEAGILEEDERIELIGGQIYIMTTKPPHAFCVTELGETLGEAFRSEAKLISQNPLRLTDDMNDRDLPQPDLMLVKRKFYLEHPKPQDVFLLIEVSDSTYNKDTKKKLPLYAKSNIHEVWIINLLQRHVEVYTEPKEGVYQSRNIYSLTASIPVTALDSVTQQWLPKEVHEVLDRFPQE
ncbi:MAG: Uma2 family endonuclease [Trueperaceae bacterium]